MKILISGLMLFNMVVTSFSQDYASDVFPTREGDLEITFIGHASIMFRWNDLHIFVDPVMREADFSQFPDADIILITHHHGDHLDVSALAALMKENTWIVMAETCSRQLANMKIPRRSVLAEWQAADQGSFSCQAIPAYNIEHKRSNGEVYHPRGAGNGYVVSFGDVKVVIGGDTENIPEYRQVAELGIDIAFLPMNLPYTMTPEMVADAAKVLQPGVLYPYHYGNTDTGELVKLLEEETGLEVRIRDF